MNFQQIKHHWITEEYCKSPFVWWEIVMLITKVLGDYIEPVEQFRTLLWANQFYFVFYIPMILLSITYITHPYTPALRSLVRWQDQTFGYLLICSLLLLIMVETSIYFAGILLIIGDQHEETVHDHGRFVILEIAAGVMAFGAIPASSIFSHWQIRKFLKKKGIEKIEKASMIKLCAIWMTFIILLILAEFFSFTTSENYYLEFLNGTFSHYLQPLTDLFKNDLYRLGIILAIIPSLSVIFYIKNSRHGKQNETNNS